MRLRSALARAWRDPRLAWLNAEIIDLEQEVGPEDGVARRCLDKAREACRRHDLNAGWAHLYRARQEWTTDRISCVLAVLLGILGAVSSAAQRSTRVKRERVTVQLGSYAASFSRIPIGAVAGLTIRLFSVATANAAAINAPNLLLASFGAGFAERLIVQGHGSDQASPPRNRPARPHPAPLRRRHPAARHGHRNLADRCGHANPSGRHSHLDPSGRHGHLDHSGRHGHLDLEDRAGTGEAAPGR